ncbi:MAG: hypothetical protein K6G76_11950 [Lachnospiraceae bacterium]|nr:hypothetical protein [Lachnospiraceae bacterium]
MDKTYEKILKLIKGNARMSYRDIVTKDDRFERVLDYVSTRTAFIRQIFTTLKKNHIHVVAVSDSPDDLKYLIKMIQKECSDDLEELHCHAVKEVVKDVYGGIRYERSVSDNNECDEQSGRSSSS